MYLKQLQECWQEDEQAIRLVKGLDEKVLKTAIAQAVVSNHLLEDLTFDDFSQSGEYKVSSC